MSSRSVWISCLVSLSLLSTLSLQPAQLLADDAERLAILEELVEEQRAQIADLEELLRATELERDKYRQALELCEASRAKEVDRCASVSAQASTYQEWTLIVGALVILTGAAFGAGVYLGR